MILEALNWLQFFFNKSNSESEVIPWTASSTLICSWTANGRGVTSALSFLLGLSCWGSGLSLQGKVWWTHCISQAQIHSCVYYKNQWWSSISHTHLAFASVSFHSLGEYWSLSTRAQLFFASHTKTKHLWISNNTYHIEWICKHQSKLDHGPVIILIDIFWTIPQVQAEDLISIQHVPLDLS